MNPSKRNDQPDDKDSHPPARAMKRVFGSDDSTASDTGSDICATVPSKRARTKNDRDHEIKLRRTLLRENSLEKQRKEELRNVIGYDFTGEAPRKHRVDARVQEERERAQAQARELKMKRRRVKDLRRELEDVQEEVVAMERENEARAASRLDIEPHLFFRMKYSDIARVSEQLLEDVELEVEAARPLSAALKTAINEAATKKLKERFEKYWEDIGMNTVYRCSTGKIHPGLNTSPEAELEDTEGHLIDLRTDLANVLDRVDMLLGDAGHLRRSNWMRAFGNYWQEKKGDGVHIRAE